MEVGAFCGMPWCALRCLGMRTVGLGVRHDLRELHFCLFQLTAPGSVPKVYALSQGFCAKGRCLASLMELSG